MLQLLREGDTLKVTRLDRISRSVLRLVTLGADLRERGIGLHVIEQGIDTFTIKGRPMFGMLSVLAGLERELIVANTNDGLASARAGGRVGWRRLTEDQVALAQRLYDEQEKTVQQIADVFGVLRSTVYGHLKTQTVPCQPKKTPVTKSSTLRLGSEIGVRGCHYGASRKRRPSAGPRQGPRPGGEVRGNGRAPAGPM
ncbi:recombinase family protein [Streptomyces avermitilis]|uniref:recombinase family protein n=1 Tax=Streptomyces avermitilis TaxID=33903 RepID=UPI00381258CA